VSLCVRHGIKVVPIPGASAFVAALAASGMPIDEFAFIGFLPSRSTERKRSLTKLAAEPRVVAIYEAPHRVLEMLEDAAEILGNRPAVIAREVTKLHEEFLRGRLSDLIESTRKKMPRGEFTVLIGPPDGAETQTTDATASENTMPLARRVEDIILERGVDRKTALKQAARERGLTRREAYKQLLITRDE
jgi:16S rRNA (cytidine1402-2'-O)-methyltransferase